MKISGQFIYDGKTYIFYTDNDRRKIYYGNKLKDRIVEVTDRKVIALMDEVLGKAFVSKDFDSHIFLKTKEYNGHKYRLFFDPASNFRYFLPESDFNLKDLNFLNYKYNELILPNNGADNNSNNKFLKRLVITKLGPIIISVNIGLSLALLLDAKPAYSDNASYVSELAMVDDNPVSSLFMAIESNNKLSQEEKTFIESVPKFYRDLYNEDNFSMILSRFKNLDISYEVGNGKKYGLNDNAIACYDWANNKIVLFKANNFSEASKDDLAHELCHVYSGCYNSFGFAIYEALNETISNEYFSTKYDIKYTYKKESAILRILFEIFGVKDIVEFYKTGNSKELINTLSRLDGNKNTTAQFINALDENTLNLVNSKDRSENNRLIYQTLKKYYNIRFGRDFDKDTDAKINYSVYDSEYDNGIGRINDVKKGYINTEYIKQFPETTYVYTEKVPDEVDMMLIDAINAGIAWSEYEDGILRIYVQDGYNYKDGHVTKNMGNLKVSTNGR